MTKEELEREARRSFEELDDRGIGDDWSDDTDLDNWEKVEK